MRPLPGSLASVMQTPELKRQRRDLVQQLYRLPLSSVEFKRCSEQLKLLDASIDVAMASDKSLLEQAKYQIDQFIETYLKP